MKRKWNYKKEEKGEESTTSKKKKSFCFEPRLKKEETSSSCESSRQHNPTFVLECCCPVSRSLPVVPEKARKAQESRERFVTLFARSLSRLLFDCSSCILELHSLSHRQWLSSCLSRDSQLDWNQFSNTITHCLKYCAKNKKESLQEVKNKHEEDSVSRQTQCRQHRLTQLFPLFYHHHHNHLAWLLLTHHSFHLLVSSHPKAFS